MKTIPQALTARLAWTVSFLVALHPTVCHSHNEHVHFRMTETAAYSSWSFMAYLYENLGWNNFPYLQGPTMVFYPPPSGTTWSASGYGPIEWLGKGAYWEDKTKYGAFEWELRSMDHFYNLNPQYQAGRVTALSDQDEPWGASFGFPGGLANSFTWASRAGTAGPYFLGVAVPPNAETWQNARSYQLAAVTSSSSATRMANFAHMLFALGHVLHLNQDSSQPDHVRNDNHFTEKHRYIENYGRTNWLTRQDSATTFPYRERLWANHPQSWTAAGFNKLQDFWDRNFYSGNAQALNNDTVPYPNFGTMLGLAEFCNGNFLGEDALYKEYFKPGDKHYFPLPSLTNTTYPQVTASLIFGANITLLRDGSQKFRVFLRKVGAGITVERHSAFNYLGLKFPMKGSPRTKVAISINDNSVLDEYHSRLIPKAIEYSDGILNYFVRGLLYVYADWDNSVGNGGKCRLTIGNYNSGQDILGGTFTLYYDTSNGTRTPVGVLTAYPGALPPGGSFTATFIPPTGNVALYTLVYSGGTIGVSGSQPLDPVDANIAVSSTSFMLHWYNIVINDQPFYQLSLREHQDTKFTITDQYGSVNSGQGFQSLPINDGLTSFGDFQLYASAPIAPNQQNTTLHYTLKTYFNSGDPVATQDFSLTTYRSGIDPEVEERIRGLTISDDNGLIVIY